MPHPPRRRALVTGASSGIGLDLAREFAKRGYDLVITARRKDALASLATELRAAHGVDIEVVALDLAAPGGAGELWLRASAGHGPAPRTIDVLVNNAGFGYYRPFSEVSWSHNADLLALNIAALTELTHNFVAAARGRQTPSQILNIASTASFQPVPNFAVYAASKAYVLHFSEALSVELARTPISVTCLCPGGVKTAFIAHAGYGSFGKFTNLTLETSHEVARIAIDAMLAGKRTRVIGLINRLGAALAPLAPRALTMRTAAIFLGKVPTTPLLADREGAATGDAAAPPAATTSTAEAADDKGTN